MCTKELAHILLFECTQVLSADYEKWTEELHLAENALTKELGPLAISACIPVYLSSVPPHTQLETSHHVLLPLLSERGVPVVWGRPQVALGSFCEPLTAPDKDSATSLPPFYPALCRAVLPRLAPLSFRTRWLEEAQSLPAVLCMSLATCSWHRSVLLYDPEDFASQWLKRWKGEELVVVDYRTRWAMQLLQRESKNTFTLCVCVCVCVRVCVCVCVTY